MSVSSRNNALLLIVERGCALGERCTRAEVQVLRERAEQTPKRARPASRVDRFVPRFEHERLASALDQKIPLLDAKLFG
jgi:hypothetical protein